MKSFTSGLTVTNFKPDANVNCEMACLKRNYIRLSGPGESWGKYMRKRYKEQAFSSMILPSARKSVQTQKKESTFSPSSAFDTSNAEGKKNCESQEQRKEKYTN